MKKENKEKIPLLLPKERFCSMADFEEWLDEKGIPGAQSGAAGDFEAFLTANQNHQDTILLWLLKEQFTTMSDFMGWLDAHRIPKEFGSWA